MAINYEPSTILKRLAKKKGIEKLIKGNLTINKAAVKTLASTGVLSEKTLERTAIKVINDYKKKYKEELKDGLSKSDAIDEAIAGKKK